MEARLVSCRVLDVDGNGVSSHDSRVLMSVINKVHYRTDSIHGWPIAIAVAWQAHALGPNHIDPAESHRPRLPSVGVIVLSASPVVLAGNNLIHPSLSRSSEDY